MAKKKATRAGAPKRKAKTRPPQSRTATKRRKAAKHKTDRPAMPVDPKHRADAEAFQQSLIDHGQAAKARPDGTLPSGATHELVKEPDGTVRAVRRRFSIL